MTVYIIDDDPFSIFLSRYLLSLEPGIRLIRGFASAGEALVQLTADGPAGYPDVLLLDLNMPGMDGWEFLEAMTGFGAQLKDKCSLYILTSSLEVTDLSRSASYPIVSGLIQKPLNREDVQLILSQHEAGEGLGKQAGD